MARVTEQDVLDIMDNTLDEDEISAHLLSANVFVTATLGDKGLSDEVLAEIERWTTAHMVASTKDRVSKEEGAGGAYIKWAGFWGKNFESTQYGQTALLLDTSGTLVALQKEKSSAWTKAVPGV